MITSLPIYCVLLRPRMLKMASSSKRLRVDMQEPSGRSAEVYKVILKVLDRLSSMEFVELTPLKFVGCNATFYPGRPFWKADCSTEESNNVFILGDIFQRGLEILFAFIDEKTIPATSSNQEKYILNKLLCYIEKDEQFPTDGLQNKSKAVLSTLLANHLFGQLAASPHYTINRNCEGAEEKCLCGTPGCKLTGHYVDTSIGNAEVWHGNLDIIINDDVGIETFEDKLDTPGDKLVKTKSTNLRRNPQIIAESVVFSFLQKQRHPERDHFLSPFIGIQGSQMVLIFYDAEQDVLLESSKIPLLDDETGKFSLLAVVISWLVVNHKYLCTGLTNKMKEYTADFFSQAETKLGTYKENLHLGSVGNSFKLDKKQSINSKDEWRSKFTTEIHKKVTDAIFRQQGDT